MLGRTASDRVDLYNDGTFIGGANLMPGAATMGKTGFWSQYGGIEGLRDKHIVRSTHLLADTAFEDVAFSGAASAYDGGMMDQDPGAVDVELYDAVDAYVGPRAHVGEREHPLRGAEPDGGRYGHRGRR